MQAPWLAGGKKGVLDTLQVLRDGKKSDIEALVGNALERDPQGDTLLHMVARGNHHSLVAALIPVLPSSALGELDCKGRTPALAVAAGGRPLKRLARVLVELLGSMSKEQICITDQFGKNVAHYCARSVRGPSSVKAFGAILQQLPCEALTAVSPGQYGDSVPGFLLRVSHRYDASLRDAAELLFGRLPELVDHIDPSTGDNLLMKAASRFHPRCLRLLVSLAKESTMLARNHHNHTVVWYLKAKMRPREVMEEVAEAIPESLLHLDTGGDSLLVPLLWNNTAVTDILLRRTPQHVLERDSKTSPDDTRRSLLFAACWHNRLSSIELLTERLGISAWAEVCRHGTPLHASLRSRFVNPRLLELWYAAVDIFPDDGFDVLPGPGASLLHSAVANKGPLELIERIIERSPPDVFVKQDSSGNSVLHSALNRGDLRIVETILAHVPEEVFFTPNWSKCTPVTRALLLQSKKITEAVLNAAPCDSLVFQCGPHDATPLHVAVGRLPGNRLLDKVLLLLSLAPHARRVADKFGRLPYEVIPTRRGNEELTEALTPQNYVKSAYT